MGDLQLDTAVVGSNGRYASVPCEDWRIWGPMGGYIASIALRAAAAEISEGLLPASFTCQFFAPARFEPVDIDVSVRRASRRTAAIATSITQDGAPILDAQAWFAAEVDVVNHDHAAPHPHGHPDDHKSISEYTFEPAPFPFWENFDAKPLGWIEDWEHYPGGAPEWAEWVKFLPTASFDDPIVEACRVLILGDLPSYPAATRAHPGGPRSWVAPNLDLSVQFHRLADLGDWLLTSGVAPIADRGLIGFRSEVWTASGVLAASGGGQLLSREVPPEAR
ncbi:MAG: thioesterase family protein [Actinomycetota bacterium]